MYMHDARVIHNADFDRTNETYERIKHISQLLVTCIVFSRHERSPGAATIHGRQDIHPLRQGGSQDGHQEEIDT
jgi:hypothetical protein